MHICVCAVDCRRGCWVPWSWSYRLLWAALCRFWEADSGPYKSACILATEPFLQLYISPVHDWIPTLLKLPFDEHLHGTQVSSNPLPIQRNPSTYFFPSLLSFSLTFKSCFFQVPDHPSSWSIGTAHVLESSHTPGHFSFQAKCTIICTVPTLLTLKISLH